MGRCSTIAVVFGVVASTVAAAGCPFSDPAALLARADEPSGGDRLAQFKIDDSEGIMTDDVGVQMEDRFSLKVGNRGPTVLEDFILRQKITHFDHERVPERAVHARGAGAHGTFTSYADWSNITAASFLGKPGKKTPTFIRFSTVLGSRGSPDTLRDVHGFATRFYTDEGNFDIVGNNIPVFFLQDAMQLVDLVHATKPNSNNEIPQASTAHDSAWDFFTQTPSTLHCMFWVMAGYGVPRSYRHMDGHGIHTYRLVTEDGKSKLIKWKFVSKQGKASLVWEEAQQIAGKHIDYHRSDLHAAIESGNGPEWELAVQIVDEDKATAYGFDMLDPTKLVPEEIAPTVKLGLLKLDRNPTNYFAETEQIMFQPTHIVRGVDFTEDPVLQGRIFSYLDTQINRHGGPNFEQLPINRPVVPVHNNNRDGAGQMYIHENRFPYSPNTLNNGFPQQPPATNNRAFLPSKLRTPSGGLVREISDTFADAWTHTRLFYNSLTPAEQQHVINAIRFELAQLKNQDIKERALIQLNKVSHDIAVRIASSIGMTAPAPDDTYYHNNVTAGMSITGEKLPTIATLKVTILASIVNDSGAVDQALKLKERFVADGLVVTIVAEHLAAGVDQVYATADSTDGDALVIVSGAAKAGLFEMGYTNGLFPTQRPLQIAAQSYQFGKPVAYFGDDQPTAQLASSGYNATLEGVYIKASIDDIVKDVEDGLRTFKFTSRFPLDSK
ncbi:catalase HPII [Microdochium nivale]|nr:catalase HPII [Microdochium nivale]